MLIKSGRLFGVLVLLAHLTACGGASSGKTSFVEAQQSPVTSISTGSQSGSSLGGSNSSPADAQILAGRITFDYVPHNLNHIGLNFLAIEKRPARGVVVELLDANGNPVAGSITDGDGRYQFNVEKNSQLRVRAKAELARYEAPTWNFSVTDNTHNNALYVLDGNLVSTGTTNSRRDLHASAGWNGVGYAAERAAAPFAILDNIYVGATRLLAAGNRHDLPPLELRWSTKNSVADGELSRGEIRTSFFNGNAIYILGDANSDADEYDSHVLLHEWAHYLEKNIFRSDSIGGDHADGETLDIRVAMSEGFANAFAAIMLEDTEYADSSGQGQASGFSFNVAAPVRASKGYFSEGSVSDILYNLYANSSGNPEGFAPIFDVLSSSEYRESDAATSIYLFYKVFATTFPSLTSLVNRFMVDQSIVGFDEWGTGETNTAGSIFALPVYKSAAADNSTTKVCSSAEFGKPNKLTNTALVNLQITRAGTYSFQLSKLSDTVYNAKPELMIYKRGLVNFHLKSSVAESLTGVTNLAAGNYLVEIYDAGNRDASNPERNTSCFNLRIAAN